jgi:histidinol-phosphate aminotransferase
VAYQLSEKLKKITPYEPISGIYKIRLDANESFFNAFKMFEKEIIEAIKKIPINRYPDPDCRKLREAYGRIYGLNPDSLAAFNGSDELLSLIIGAFLEEGQSIVTLAPDFSMYGFYADIYGRKMVSIERQESKDNGMATGVDRVLSVLEEHDGAALLFSNPGSPSSGLMKRRDVIRIIEEAGGLVIVDEAYMDFSDESVMDLVDRYSNLIVIKTCSKAWGMAALRLGFAVSSKEIIKALNSLRSPYNINAYTQEIAGVILSHPEFLEKSVTEMRMGRDELYEQLLNIFEGRGLGKVRKSHTNFIYIETLQGEKIFEELKKKSIIIRKMGNSLRITVGNRDENKALVDGLIEILREI